VSKLTAIFPGSFDPLTLGHVDLVTRALEVFDHVVVAVLDHYGKKSLFSPAERVKLGQEVFKEYGSRVTVESFTGLLVDYAKSKDCRVILRGLRAISDYDYEAQMALMNRKLCDSVETLFMMSREPYSYISSTLVKQVAPVGGDVSTLVPPVVEKRLKEMYQK
jgi:pantetheine-phosphate adenylyltransferase